MKASLFCIRVLIPLVMLLSLGSLVQAEPAPTPPLAKTAKTAKKAKKTTTANKPKQIATSLPAFKGKKRVVTTSSNLRSSDDAQTGVVVRSMSAAEYTKYAAKMAEEEKQAATAPQIVSVKRVAIAKPRPVETLRVTAAEEDNSPDVGEAPRPKITEPPVFEPRIQSASALIPVPIAPPAPAPTPSPTPEVPFVITMPTPAPSQPILQVQVPPARPQTEAVYEAKANEIQDEKQNLFNNRVSVSSSYLAAQYSQIEGQLENGATTIGLGYSHDFGVVEGTAALEFVHGLDQSVTPSNARMLMLRGDAAYFFSKSLISPFVSGGLAIAKVNVESYRLQNDGTTVLRDYDSTTALGITPAAGVRLRITPRFDVEFKVEELAFLLGSNASALGGLSAGGGVGFSF